MKQLKTEYISWINDKSNLVDKNDKSKIFTIDSIFNIIIIVLGISAIILTIISIILNSEIHIKERKIKEYEKEINGYSIQLNHKAKINIVDSYEMTPNIDYFAKCVMAEAGNQDEVGKRLVIDVIINRINNENFPNTIEDVINQPNQFEVVSTGKINEVIPTDDIYTLIQEEMKNITNDEVLYFRTEHYHTFGTPLFQHQDHYFSR